MELVYLACGSAVDRAAKISGMPSSIAELVASPFLIVDRYSRCKIWEPGKADVRS